MKDGKFFFFFSVKDEIVNILGFSDVTTEAMTARRHPLAEHKQIGIAVS